MDSESFFDILNMQLCDQYESIKNADAIVVAVSGGPDSMALLHALSRWSNDCDGPNIHAVIVDHALRSESAQEAAHVAHSIASWARVQTAVITLDMNAPDSRIMESARNARYEALIHYCCTHEIVHMFLGHHLDDQAETVLFRLAKGSGLDGLAGMSTIYKFNDEVSALRPLLGVPKDELLAYCAAHSIVYLQDPSNESDRFLRARMRQSKKILEQEGLSNKRLFVTAKRLERARNALDYITNSTLQDAVLSRGSERIVLKLSVVQNAQEEIVIRMISRAFKELQSHKAYLPRMEKIESLCSDVINEKPFRKRTLGGLVFTRDERAQKLIIEKEK